MRRIAPFLTFVIVAGALYWSLEGTPSFPRRQAGSGKQQGAEDAATRASTAQSQPTTRPVPDPVAIAAAESGPAESRPASAPVVPVVVVELVRDDGKPIAGATVGVIGGEVRPQAETDASGRLEIPAHEGETAAILVRGSNFETFETTISLDTGIRRIVVPSRSRVAGRVTVSGHAPDEPIRLRIDGDESLPKDENRSPHFTSTDESGAFEFFNLPANWTGELWFPGAYVLADRLAHASPDPPREDSNRIRLEAPNPALAVRLDERPTIKGRILSHGAKEGMQGSVIAKVQAATESSSTQLFTNDNGRFRVFVNPDTVHVTLAIADAHFLGTRTIEVDGPFDQVRNVGDIEIGSAHQIAFRVRDSAGHPIAGAVGEISETWSVSDPTDAEGKSVISTDQGKRDLRVGKLGYAVAAVPVPEDGTAPIDVELRGGNQLIIDVRLADRSIPTVDPPHVHLSSRDALFSGPHDMLDALLRRTGVTESIEEGKSAEGSNIVFVPDEHGRVVVAGFRPGAEVSVQLRGPALDELLDESFVVIDAAGTKTITLRTQVMPQRFLGLVRAANGDPIDGASVRMWVKGSQGEQETLSEAEGLFGVDAVFASSVHVQIYREGFVTFRQNDVPVPLNGARRDFTMIPSRDVTIVLVDERGRRIVEEAEIVVRIADAPEDEQPGAPEDQLDGSYLARGLPPGPIEISATVGVCHVGIRQDSRTPTARLIIPSEGGAELHWRRDRGDPALCRIRVESLQAGAAGFVGDVPAEVTDHYLEARLPPGEYWAVAERFDAEEGRWMGFASSRTFTISLHQGTLVEIAR